MKFSVAVKISPRKDILDPQGKAVEQALISLGYAVAGGVLVGKYISFTLDADSREVAARQVGEMCKKLLANPVVEDYEIEVGETAR